MLNLTIMKRTALTLYNAQPDHYEAKSSYLIQCSTWPLWSQELLPYTMLNLTIMKPRALTLYNAQPLWSQELLPYTMLNLTIMKPRALTLYNAQPLWSQELLPYTMLNLTIMKPRALTLYNAQPDHYEAKSSYLIQCSTWPLWSQELLPYRMLNLTIMKPRALTLYNAQPLWSQEVQCIYMYGTELYVLVQTLISITHLNQHGSSAPHLYIPVLHTLDEKHICLDQGGLAGLQPHLIW